ncbi:MAG TPA: PIN domain nuclease [Caldilineae bacterium]|nr:PIN domain nuclease [Caldilineae bacterium]
MVLIDSSVWIDYFNGRTTLETDYLNSILGEVEIVVGDVILAEVLQGFRHDKDFKLAKWALEQFPWVDMVGPDMAIASAQNYRTLRRRGITIRKTLDCLIATYAISHQLDFLHNDRDFDPFEKYLGLQVIHPDE